MARTLTIELTDELEQQVMVQAKQQQVSPESIVLQSLSQTLTTNQVEVQNHESQSDLTRVISLDPLDQFIGATHHGNLAQNIDGDVYE